MLASLIEQRAWIKALIEFYRGMGYFRLYDGMDAEAVARIVRKNLEATENEEGTSSLVTEYFRRDELANVELCILRQGHVASGYVVDEDVSDPVFQDDRKYLSMLDEVALISRGSLHPKTLREHWNESNRVTVSFLLDGQQIQFSTLLGQFAFGAIFPRWIDTVLHAKQKGLFVLLDDEWPTAIILSSAEAIRIARERHLSLKEYTAWAE